MFHCPYCGDEELTPHGDGADAWRCSACLRALVRLLWCGFGTTSVGSAEILSRSGRPGTGVPTTSPSVISW